MLTEIATEQITFTASHLNGASNKILCAATQLWVKIKRQRKPHEEEAGEGDGEADKEPNNKKMIHVKTAKLVWLRRNYSTLEIFLA